MNIIEYAAVVAVAHHCLSIARDQTAGRRRGHLAHTNYTTNGPLVKIDTVQLPRVTILYKSILITKKLAYCFFLMIEWALIYAQFMCINLHSFCHVIIIL